MSKQRSASVIVVFAFIRQGDEVLLVERALPPYKGTRTIPGGHKEPGEELGAACRREIEEETGLQLHDARFAGIMQVHRPEYPGPEYLCVYFVSDSFSGTVTPGREGSLAWTKIQSVHGDMTTHPALRALLPYIENNDFPFMAEARTDSEGRGVYTVTGCGPDPATVTRHYE